MPFTPHNSTIQRQAHLPHSYNVVYSVFSIPNFSSLRNYFQITFLLLNQFNIQKNVFTNTCQRTRLTYH